MRDNRARVATAAPLSLVGPSLDPTTIYTTETVQISEVHIVNHCRENRDGNVIHDKEHNVIPGPLLFSRASGLVETASRKVVSGIPMFRRIRDWKFQRTSFAGDSIYLTFTISEPEAIGRSEALIIVLTLRMYNQREEVIGRGEWEMTLYPAPPAK